MITIYYSYVTKDGDVKQGQNTFYDIDKAVKFAWMCIKSKDKHYQHYSCDDSEENEEMWRRLP